MTATTVMYTACLVGSVLFIVEAIDFARWWARHWPERKPRQRLLDGAVCIAVFGLAAGMVWTAVRGLMTGAK